MRRLISLIFCLLSAGMIELSGNSRLIYVAPNGNDNNEGTKESPLATPNEACERIHRWRAAGEATGDTIRVRIARGDYFLTEPLVFNADNSGLENSPVIFEGYGGAKPILYGGIRLNPFQTVNDTLWRVYIPEVKLYGFDFEQLYVNGERRFRAQTPDRGSFYNVAAAEQTVLDTTGYRTPAWATIRVASQQPLPKLTNAGEALAWFYHKWDVSKFPIIHQDASDSTLLFSAPGMQPWNPIDARTRFIIENDWSCLDAPGEWFLDKNEGYLYYIPYPGERVENTVCIAPMLEKLITIQGDETQSVQNLHFKNLALYAVSYNTPTLGNGPEQAAASVPAAVEANFARNVNFESCEIAHTGVSGIWFRRACTNCSIKQSKIFDIGACGVKIGETVIRPNVSEITNHITVDNNIIQHGGYTFPCAVGVIIFNASDNKITHNDIADFRYTGISVGWVWGYGNSPSKRNRIEYNHIHHLGWGELSDMGGIYTLGLSEGTTLSNNKIHHIYSLYYGGWGLYTDEGSTGIILERNLVYKCKSGGFHQHYGADNIVRNNIFGGQIRTQLEATREEDHTSFRFANNIVWFDSGILGGIAWEKVGFKSDYNCYWDTRTTNIEIVPGLSFKDWQAKGKDTHSIITDPGFDPANGDFTVKDKQLCRKIRFIPFDYNKAGVYGSDEWKKEAELDPALIEAFDRQVEEYEKLGLSNF